VSVGIADYSGYPVRAGNLSNTVNDAKTMASLYSKNTYVSYALLLNANATKRKLLKAMNKVFAMAGQDDIVLFFFSGHGYPGAICAYDGPVSYAEIRNAMSKSKSKNKLMFVDACYSGAIRGTSSNHRSDLEEAKKANVLLFLSSRTEETSMERKDMQNGFFTTYLQKGLKGGADGDRNRAITAKELFDYVSNGVSQLSGGSQHPVMWGNFDDNMVVMQW
jgi:uncharacterized caspase-like protein